MADAPELERDVKLQRDSADLIADLKSSLKPFLWKTTTAGELKIKRRVKQNDLERLVQLLDQFQELPQLLDPHLDGFVPLLADSFLAYLRLPPPKQPSPYPEQLIPLYKAICKLLYTLCKVRGDKIIVRFFSTETRNLELLVSAIETGTKSFNSVSLSTPTEHDLAQEASWHWEEIYITLLWLSQLLLAPFDLASISSDSSQNLKPSIPGLEVLDQIPGVALRVIALAHRFLSSTGKERDAAKVLLVRIAMRKDMQDLGVLNALISWALSRFSIERECPNTFESLGTLSFIAGLLTSSIGTTNMDFYLSRIYEVTREISDQDNKQFKSIHASPVARKVIIKILRTVSVISLQRPSSISTSGITEAVINHLLDSLADQATPVRLAGSKALSIITSKLAPEMADDVVEVVLEGFEKNVPKAKPGDTKSSRDLSRVNRFEWHGLTLTLSHLIFRRSIPPANISSILRALRLALSFEQQSTSGSAVGSNVRDAACFGMWALARRYTTKELQSLEIGLDVVSLLGKTEGSALQILATDLVVGASLDPEGNIRRGCSAALQELIGRHPDTIAQGIRVVQVVDYHAVALRSRAVEEVAIEVAKLSEYYYSGILKGLLSWRGVCDPNASARRVAAMTVGKLSALARIVWPKQSRSADTWKEVSDIVEMIVPRITGLALRDNDERHGLILSLAAVTQQFSLGLTRPNIDEELAFGTAFPPADRLALATDSESSSDYDSDESLEERFPLLKLTDTESPLYAMTRALLGRLLVTLSTMNNILDNVRQPQLIADSVSHLIVSSWRLLRAECIFRDFDSRRVQWIHAIAISPIENTDPTVRLQQAMFKERQNMVLMDLLEIGPYSSWPSNCSLRASADNIFRPDELLIKVSRNLITRFLSFGDPDTIDVVSQAAVDLVSLLGRQEASIWIAEWKMHGLSVRVPARKEMGRAYLHAVFKLPIYAEGFMLGAMCDRMSDQFREEIIHAVHSRWNAPTALPDVELKVVILRCLTSSFILRQRPSAFAQILISALDDYTTNARGDIGSLLRVEAAKAVTAIWDSRHLIQPMPNSPEVRISTELFPRIMRIASEKLDRVRAEGRKALLKFDFHEVTAEPIPINSLPEFLHDVIFDDTHGTGMPGSFYDPLLSDSSKEYFRHLLDLRTEVWGVKPVPNLQSWSPEFMAGYVTSADTGSEDLVRASRAALIEYCTLSSRHTMYITDTLTQTLHRNLKKDRVLIPTLEVIAFLLDMNLIYAEKEKYQTLRHIYSSIDEGAFRTKNVRKIEAIIKCLGGLFEIWSKDKTVFETSPIRLLVRFLQHKFPNVRNCAADEIWTRTESKLVKTIDWEKAGKQDPKNLEFDLYLRKVW